MSRNQAAYLLTRPERFRVRFIHVLARWFVGITVTLATLSALAQLAEVKAASDVANAIAKQDNSWLLAFAIVVANITLLAVAKAYQQVTRESQITAVETARAMQRMADSIDKLANVTTIHDERAIKFIDNQTFHGHQGK